ncbi:MAG: adenosylcobalamin-dependent ribonucleoside-diphosphate reductase [Nanoarchaeota archaeon]|nr:adenosylcobalamin-dependent ribonucleoside-diphosphate reductase [Nanoarchaeota archaeon]
MEEMDLEKRAEGFPDYVGSGSWVEGLTSNQTYALEKKYLVRNDDGEVIETPAEAVHRMSRTMAEVEFQYDASEEEVDSWTQEFYGMIANGQFSPAGRIWTNAGTDIKALFNCYVLPVHDSMDRDEGGSIFNSVRDAAVIHKNGGGTGYNFSELRPRGTYVQKSKGIASGVVSFIGSFDQETTIINSGNRRGANMGILDVTHPDIMDFIYAKAARGEITNFNVSLGATDSFMQAVDDSEFYDLEFAGKKLHHTVLEQIIRNVEENKVGGAEVGAKPKPASLRLDLREGLDVVPGETKVVDTYVDKVAGRVSEDGIVQLYAPYVLDTVAELAWKTGDPGMIFLDAINRCNSLPDQGPIKATNPCGEQPLHPYDACNLGSVVLSEMITESESGDFCVDYEKIGITVKTMTRFMDNVNDASKGPIPEIEETVLRHRRIGMGVMGWADMLIKLGIPYSSEDARALAGEVMGFITDTAKSASVELANEKGVFPDFEGSTYDDGNPANRVRNVDRTTIAPTGTISMLYNTSSGVEPIFSVAYRKNIRGNDTLEYVHPGFEAEVIKRGLDLEKILALSSKNHGSVQGIEEVPEDLQRVFLSAHDLSYQEHLAIQAAFQRNTDNAVSKTINMRNDASVADVRSAYILAWRSGLKGTTVYRDGAKKIQVLETGSKKKDEGVFSGVVDLTKIERPNAVGGRTVRMQTPYNFEGRHLNAFMTLNRILEEDDLGRAYEFFISMGRAGGDLHANMEGYGRLISLALKKGATPDEIYEQLIGITGETQKGIGHNAVRSLPDTIAKGIEKILLSEGKKVNGNKGLSGNLCPECSGPLAMEEGCQKCLNPKCGYSKC